MGHDVISRLTARWPLVALVLLATVISTSIATIADSDEHPVVGRFSIISGAGGAVWTFQSSGMLVIIGPGEIVSEGTWTPAAGDREFDAAVDVTITGQRLEVLGQVSPDGTIVAVYVSATEPERPEDWVAWPAESRLTGERFGMTPDPETSPTPSPPDCVRPDWIDGRVDWDRCDAIVPTGA